MCGRIALYTPPARLARLLDAALAAGVEADTAPSWNVPPQRTLFGVAEGRDGRVLDAYTWGLVPWFAKDASMSNRSFNARAETMSSRPAFRDAFERHRLLIPVDGFFEWDRRASSRDAHFFTRADGDVLVLAGLYDRWTDPADPPDAPRHKTCTVVTTTPGPDLDGIHDRMPAVLERDAFELWLDGTADELDAVRDLCGPAPRGTLVHHRVDGRVGNVRNDDSGLIAAVAAASTLFDQLGEQ